MSNIVISDFGRLKADLATLPKKMLETALEELMQQAQLMSGLAKVYAPVDTGSLRDSIRVERGGEGEWWRRVRVRAGGYIVNPKTKKLVDYAAVVEHKQPYMAPAYDEVKNNIEALIRRGVVEKCST